MDLSDHEADLQQLEVDLRELQLRHTSIQEAIREVSRFGGAMHTHAFDINELTMTSSVQKTAALAPLEAKERNEKQRNENIKKVRHHQHGHLADV